MDNETKVDGATSAQKASLLPFPANDDPLLRQIRTARYAPEKVRDCAVTLRVYYIEHRIVEPKTPFEERANREIVNVFAWLVDALSASKILNSAVMVRARAYTEEFKKAALDGKSALDNVHEHAEKERCRLLCDMSL